MQIGSNPAPEAAPRQPPPGRRFRVLLSKGPAVRTEVLSGSRWTVGRGDDCDLRLLDPTIATLHVIFEAAGDTLAFRDLTSNDRVRLDGRPCREGRLATGSTLLIGTTRLTAEPLGRASRVSSGRGLRRLPWVRARGPATERTIVDEWLRALAPLLRPFGDADDVGHAALAACMDGLGRDLGSLARLDEDRVTVLASVSRPPNTAKLKPSRALLRKARTASAPWIDSAIGPLRTRREQLVVPVGAGAGAMLLALARPDAPPLRDGCALATLAGAIVWLHVRQAELARRRSRSARSRAPDPPTLAALEARHIRRVLQLFHGNKRAAARVLGIATSTLYDRLRRLESGAE